MTTQPEAHQLSRRLSQAAHELEAVYNTLMRPPRLSGEQWDDLAQLAGEICEDVSTLRRQLDKLRAAHPYIGT